MGGRDGDGGTGQQGTASITSIYVNCTNTLVIVLTFVQQLCDVLALVGDVADNIPGVKGVGQRTAAALVHHFGSVEAILDA